MKTLIIFLLIVCGMFTGRAQVVQLEETKVEFAPYTVITASGLDAYEVVLDERFKGEFSNNALKFVKENFNIKELISTLKKSSSNRAVDPLLAVYSGGYHTFIVSFRISKGNLDATYSEDGNMRYSYQTFKDVVLPLEIRRNLYANYEGWTMVKNKYVASGNGDKLDREIYRINLMKDNKRQNIKIIPSRIGSDRVVSN